MRKNIAKVLDAFAAGKASKGATCSTDGERIFSYSTPIAERGSDGMVWILAEKGQSMTTKMQIRACRQKLRAIVICGDHEDCRGDRNLAKACADGERGTS